MFQNLIDSNIISELSEQFSETQKYETMFHAIDEIPVLPIKNSLLFPNTTIPLQVSQPKSVALIHQLKPKMPVLFVLKKSQGETPKDFYEVGTVGFIIRSIETPVGGFNILIQGRERARILSFTQTDPFFVAKISISQTLPLPDEENSGYLHAIKEIAKQIVELSPSIPNDVLGILDDIQNLSLLIYLTALNLNVDLHEKYKVLSDDDLKRRAEHVLHHLNKELETLKLSTEIQSRVRADIDKTQKDYFLRHQLKAIQEELGDNESLSDEVSVLRKKLKSLQLPKEDDKFLAKEIDKLSRITNVSPEYAPLYNYLDFAISLPWKKFTKDEIDINKAKKALDKDHEGLQKVKDRVLEFIAVLQLRSKLKGPILCFCGPPGVGKTSLGLSIANALGRKFVRAALGSVSDEAELRGHRRTYIGSMPGRILQGVKRADSSNPVFILDEVDKMGIGYRGDPTAALLEILDPAQNHSFSDHYLEIAFDLSNVLFIATANYADNIPAPLLDRMEVIELNGYTNAEKIKIGNKHLIKRQLSEHGLSKKQLKINSKAMSRLIEDYTRESGVRDLERMLGKICRVVAKNIVSKKAKTFPVVIDESNLKEYLGYEKFTHEEYPGSGLKNGVAIGLAWTPVGGDVLYIEALLTKGSGKLVLTGQLGDVMKESASAALTFLKSQASVFSIPQKAFDIWDVHLHVPQGAIPKDGPSAGITILCALASAYTKRSFKPRLAMTGEVTLRGEILPVGGIKEKLLAAKRFRIKKVFLSERNKKDVNEILSESRTAFNGLAIHYFKDMLEVINQALVPRKKSDTPLEEIYQTEKENKTFVST